MSPDAATDCSASFRRCITNLRQSSGIEKPGLWASHKARLPPKWILAVARVEARALGILSYTGGASDRASMGILHMHLD